MRILLVSGNFHWSEGAIAKGIVKALPEDDIYFFSVHEFKYRYKELERLLNEVDVVHWLFNVGHLKGDRKIVYRNISIPQIATVHHVCEDENYKTEEASYANTIHVVSNEWLHYLKDNTETKVISASLGIMLDDFKPIKANLYSGKGTFKIGIMGSYPGKDNRKRIDIALKVLKNLVLKGVDFELVIQGIGWEKYYKDLKESGVKYTHHRLTSDSEALKFFELIHVYLCTSDYEGGPLPVLESLASGVPVVSTNVGVAADALEKGGGILCPKGDVVALLNALILLKEKHDLYIEYALEAKKSASKYYSWESLGLAYKTLFNETILEWENVNLRPWVFRSKKIQKAKKQRETELLYDDLSQSLQLLKRGKKIEGLKLACKPILSIKIKMKRKVIFLQRSIIFFIGKG